MVKFTVEQKLQALNLLKEVCSSCSLAQPIDTWVAHTSPEHIARP